MTLMYEIKVSKFAGPEYVAAANDLLRMLVIQVFTHIMLSLADPVTCLFSPEFWVTVGYLLVSTAFYHLIFTRVFPVR